MGGEATYRKGLGAQEGPKGGTPNSVSEWGEPPTCSKEILGELQRMILWGGEKSWGSLALHSPSSSLSLHLSGLWKVKGWPKERGDADVTSQAPGSFWKLLYFYLSTPQPGLREGPPGFLLPAWELTSWTVAAILASSTFITLPAWTPSLREDGTRMAETPLCS